MVELQPGTLLEERRGGSAILSTLISEMIENSTNGYIRCERTPKEEMPRVGQIVIYNREIVAAFFESKRPQTVLDQATKEYNSRNTRCKTSDHTNKREYAKLKLMQKKKV